MILLFIILSTLTVGLLGKAQKTLFTPNDFKYDPYGYTTNQMAHIFTGIGLVFIPMLIGYFATGELPSRLYSFYMIFFGVCAYQIMQGGKIFDIIEDIVFTAVYGSGTYLYCFHWTTGSRAETDLLYHPPFFVIIYLHIILGANKRKNAANDLDS